MLLGRVPSLGLACLSLPAGFAETFALLCTVSRTQGAPLKGLELLPQLHSFCDAHCRMGSFPTVTQASLLRRPYRDAVEPRFFFFFFFRRSCAWPDTDLKYCSTNLFTSHQHICLLQVASFVSDTGSKFLLSKLSYDAQGQDKGK